MCIIQIAVWIRNEPPNASKHWPRANETHCKHQYRPAPLCIDQRRKYVLKTRAKTQTPKEKIILKKFVCVLFDDVKRLNATGVQTGERTINYLQITTTSFGYISLNDIAVSVLENNTFSHTSRRKPCLAVSAQQKNEQKKIY